MRKKCEVDSLDKILERQKSLSNIALQLSEVDNFRGKSQELIDVVGPLSDSDSIHTYRFDEKTNRYTIVSSWYSGEERKTNCLFYCHSMTKQELSDELYDKLYAGTPQFYDKDAIKVELPEWVHNTVIYGFSALGQLQGILVYSTSRKEGWDTLTIEWLHTIASMISSAIRRTFYYEKLQLEIAWRDQVYPIIAHDLRSGVGTVKMLSEGAEMASNIDELREFILMISHSADETFMLLDNLLKWSRSRISTNHPVKEQIEIVGFIKEILSAFRETALTKDIALLYSADPECYNLELDVEMIRTVIRNLIANAMKFTPKGGEITVSCCETEGKIEISVSDNGIGIPPEVVEVLLNGSRHITTYGTVGEKGSGLGLSLVRDFLRIHGSELHIDSRQGDGSRFSFKL